MIEVSGFPSSSGVTLGAVMRKAARFMIGIISSGKGSCVTTVAIRRRAGVASAVTGLALQCRMRTCKCELGQVVIKIRRLPRSGGVTLSAVM